MMSIMARTIHESSSFSFSRRFFHWKLGNGGCDTSHGREYEDHVEEIAFTAFDLNSSSSYDEVVAPQVEPPARKKHSSSVSAAATRVRSLLRAVVVGLRHRQAGGLGHRVTGTIFGHRRGHVHLAFQADPRACPAVLIELASPMCALVKEMASGMVRIALKCERRPAEAGGGGGNRNRRLLEEEQLWRAYCNGKKWGHAVRRECGPLEWRVLRAVEAVSVGAGVLPEGGGGEGDMMYMRARFERVVGSKDSEALYMMNPTENDNDGQELTVYFIRF